MDPATFMREWAFLLWRHLRVSYRNSSEPGLSMSNYLAFLLWRQPLRPATDGRDGTRTEWWEKGAHQTEETIFTGGHFSHVHDHVHDHITLVYFKVVTSLAYHMAIIIGLNCIHQYPSKVAVVSHLAPLTAPNDTKLLIRDCSNTIIHVITVLVLN